ncbi:MAG: permease prefix domain 1-containing protein [Candidatus Izemoplasmatales bacterium]|jgi:tetrahydromethanopterin S-methyltransferase subunit B
MNKIKAFVSKLLKDILNDEDKKELIEILTQSLEEKVDDLVEQGTPLDEAIDRSINEFGDAKDVLEGYPEMGNKKAKIKLCKNQFYFSIFGYLIIVGLALFFNLQFYAFFKEFNWYVLVIIGVLFWPIVMLFRYLAVKK